MNPRDYNATELAAGRLTLDHLTTAIREFQLGHGLDPDGAAGPQTRAALEALTKARAVHVKDALAALDRIWPLRCLANGRKPEITSGHFKVNPSRPTHRGCDLFFRHLADDPHDVKRGDGLGAGTEADGTVKWWIPPGTQAVASLAGKVVRASASPTGYRVWIDVGPCFDGYFHLRDLKVAVGQQVEQGQALGTVGDNPSEIDAAHLHFEIFVGDLELYRVATTSSLDPEPHLRHARYLPA